MVSHRIDVMPGPGGEIAVVEFVYDAVTRMGDMIIEFGGGEVTTYHDVPMSEFQDMRANCYYLSVDEHYRRYIRDVYEYSDIDIR